MVYILLVEINRKWQLVDLGKSKYLNVDFFSDYCIVWGMSEVNLETQKSAWQISSKGHHHKLELRVFSKYYTSFVVFAQYNATASSGILFSYIREVHYLFNVRNEEHNRLLCQDVRYLH